MKDQHLLFFVTEDWYFVSHRLSLAVAARNAGMRVSVVTNVNEHGQIIRDAGLELIPFEVKRAGTNFVYEFLTILRLIKVYRKEKPDVVHHVAMKPVLYGAIAAHVADVPKQVNALAGMGWLFTSKAWLPRLFKPLVRAGLRHALRRGIALVQNPDDALLLAQIGVPIAQIRRIAGSGIDLSAYAPVRESRSTPIVVLPARLLWDKGVKEFVDAARKLKERNVKARFVLAGAPDPQNPASVTDEDIQQWVKEGVIEYMGWVSDMPSLLASANVVCLPSYREGLPKSLLEAAAAGRAIVTTNVPGCRELVRDGESGLLVPARDSNALADALARLINDADLRETFGLRGRERAEQEFASDIVIPQTIALYNEPALRTQ